MISLPEEKVLYSEIQKKLYYIVPEKWESIYLYTSIVDMPGGKPSGELYFYYIPKGFIKKKPVNCYEIPSLFDIDEEEYSELITDLYNLMKSLRLAYAKRKGRAWTNVNIIIENYQFKVEFGFEDLKNTEYNSYERHVIWRYKYLDVDLDSFSKKDKKIIEKYLDYEKKHGYMKKDLYIEGIYKATGKNIVDFEKTLTVDEAIAQQKQPEKNKPKKIRLKKEEPQEQQEAESVNNQILNFGNKPIKRD